MTNYRLGDVVHVTRLNHATVNAWAIVTRAGTGLGVRWIGKRPAYEDADGYLAGILGCDTYSRPHPDAWPQEVCVAVARYQLTGELA